MTLTPCTTMMMRLHVRQQLYQNIRGAQTGDMPACADGLGTSCNACDGARRTKPPEWCREQTRESIFVPVSTSLMKHRRTSFLLVGETPACGCRPIASAIQHNKLCMNLAPTKSARSILNEHVPASPQVTFCVLQQDGVAA